MVNATFPDIIILNNQLSTLFVDEKFPAIPFEILSRKVSIHSSTFPAEIIECRIPSGACVKLLCKYLSDCEHNCFGHRGGIEYEGRVYDEVLRNIPLSTAKYYGSCKDTENNEVWLVIEYLEGCISIKDSKELDPAAKLDLFAKAATWIGNLHRLQESNAPSFIKKYNASYYNLWVEAIHSDGQRLKKHFLWLQNVCDYFQKNLYLLTDSTQTLIHGEFYPGNVLFKNNLIYPIDWESAAYGPGEIDLATLIHGWDETRMKIAIENYCSSRWLDANFSKKEFEQRLLHARIYSYLRWIGEWPSYLEEWLKKPETFDELYLIGKEAGCV